MPQSKVYVEGSGGRAQAGERNVSTKSAKIKAQIAELEAAMAEAQAREREIMRDRVAKVAERSGLIDVMLSSKQLAIAFRSIIDNPPAEPEAKTRKGGEDNEHE